MCVCLNILVDEGTKELDKGSNVILKKCSYLHETREKINEPLDWCQYHSARRAISGAASGTTVMTA